MDELIEPGVDNVVNKIVKEVTKDENDLLKDYVKNEGVKHIIIKDQASFTIMAVLQVLSENKALRNFFIQTDSPSEVCQMIKKFYISMFKNTFAFMENKVSIKDL